MHISSVIKISFCRIPFSSHQNKFCACLDSIYGSRVILVMCKNCSDISWHRLNLNQSKTNCRKNLNSDGLIVREMGPWPECIFRSLLQFLVEEVDMKSRCTLHWYAEYVVVILKQNPVNWIHISITQCLKQYNAAIELCEEFLTYHTIHIDICFPLSYKPETSEISWWTGSALSTQPIRQVKIYQFINYHFCNSPVSVKRKYADMLAVEKQDMAEEESSHGALLSSLMKIRERQWSVSNFNGDEKGTMIEFIYTSSWHLLTVHSVICMLHCISRTARLTYLYFCILCVFLYGTNVSE